MPQVPEWKPLEEFIVDVYRQEKQDCSPRLINRFCGRFMFMGETQSGGKTLWLYKEIDTRKYLNLTADSVPHAFCRGIYTPITYAEALINVGEMF